MKIKKNLKDYEKLKSLISQTGMILPGTITERFIVKEDKKLGPYYQWTYKKSGKTITVNLSSQQLKKFRKAISNNKELEERITQMRHLSLDILTETTEGVKKRKPPKSL